MASVDKLVIVRDSSTSLVNDVGDNTNNALRVNVVAQAAVGGAAAAPATASVTGTSAQAVAANAARTKLVIVNLGTGNVFFGLGATAELNKGIALTQYGTWVMDAATFTRAAINAISSSTATLSVQEFS